MTGRLDDDEDDIGYLDGSWTVGSAAPLQEYDKPRRKRVRKRPIGFLRDDWPDIIDGVIE